MSAGEFEGRRCLVVGLGRFGGGLGAARWLAGAGARVTVTDGAPAESLAASVAALGPLVAEGRVALALGGHAVDPTAWDLVVANPAVPPGAPLLVAARAAGVRVTSEVELYLERTRAAVVAVTGTQGKSSTVTFTAQLLEAGGLPAAVGGNLGGSLVESLAEEGPGARRVLELSSYQLEALGPRPRRVARAVAVTNVLADHLDRHGSLEAYGAAKARLLELCRPGGRALLPVDGPPADWRPEGLEVLRHGPGGALAVEGGWLRVGGRRFGGLPPGLPRFQAANALVAVGLALELGLEPERVEAALGALRAPSHRCEALPPVRGRAIVDNGVATTPDATLGVLASVAPGATVLLGGRSKGLAWDALGRALAARGDRAVAFGHAAEELHAALAPLGVPCALAADVAEAVARGLSLTPEGATLLFSPACASFDAHANFAERAAAFRAAVERARTPDGGAPAERPGADRGPRPTGRPAGGV